MCVLKVESEVSDGLENHNRVIFRRVREITERLLKLFHPSIFIHKTPKEPPDEFLWNLVLRKF